MEKQFFFIIGGQRCGTTYLYTLLDEHPEIDMAKPLKPEPRFFLSNEIKFGQKYYEDKYYTYPNYKAFGEKSTTYYEKPEIIKNILSFYPRAKFIMLIRNPVERAISNYYFTKNNGLETRTIEEVFIDKIPEPQYPKKLSTNPFNYIQRGKYYNYLKPYLETLSDEQFKIVLFENLIKNEKEINHIYNFLGVNDNYIPNSLNKKINKSTKEIISKKIIEILNQEFKYSNSVLFEKLGIELY